MSGFLSLIFATILGGSALSAAADNAAVRNIRYQLPDGREYYFDRLGKTYLCGSAIQIMQFGDLWIDKNYNVICDSGREKFKKDCEAAIAENPNRTIFVAYSRECKCRALFERKTKKQLAKIVRNKDHECRKFYFYDYRNDIDAVRKESKLAMRENTKEVFGKPDPNNIRKDDEGIEITEAEFEAIKNEMKDVDPLLRDSYRFFTIDDWCKYNTRRY